MRTEPASAAERGDAIGRARSIPSWAAGQSRAFCRQRSCYLKKGRRPLSPNEQSAIGPLALDLLDLGLLGFQLIHVVREEHATRNADEHAEQCDGVVVERNRVDEVRQGGNE